MKLATTILSAIFCRGILSQRGVSGVRIAFAAYLAVVVAGTFVGWTQWVVLGLSLDGSPGPTFLLVFAGRAVLVGIPAILLFWRSCDDLMIMLMLIFLLATLASIIGCATQDHFVSEALVERSLQMLDESTSAIVAGPQIGRLSTTRAMTKLRHACELRKLDMETMEVYIEVRPKSAVP